MRQTPLEGRTMVDMRFGGVPRFVTGLRIGTWEGGNDNLPPRLPDAIAAAGRQGVVRSSPRYPRRIVSAVQTRFRAHLRVVK